MRTIVTFSGGKDSLAALLWIRNNFTKNFTTVFCDTGFEHPLTYQYINEVADKLQLDLVTLKSKKYDNLIDLAKKTTGFRYFRTRRNCSQCLKIMPTIDFLLDVVNDDFVVIQGIRAKESANRAKMEAQCNYFKHYIVPYGKDKNGKDKFNTYRRKKVLSFSNNHANDILRPVFEWSAQQTIDYILENKLKPNPLYKMGFSRVGCFPCVFITKPELYQLSKRFPERILELAKYEEECKSSFFNADYIPKYAYKGRYPLIEDVIKYVQNKHDAGTLFEEYSDATSCMSYYAGICE